MSCSTAGREAATAGLCLSRAGVRTDDVTGKIIVDSQETTSAQNIFAVGDAMLVSVVAVVFFPSLDNKGR